MKWLRKIDKQAFFIVCSPIIIATLASLVASWVTRNSDYFVFIIGTFSILIIFGLVISYQAGRLSERVENSLDKRLPEIKFILGEPRDLESEIVNTVRHAKSFIAATGEKASITDYLEAIENKVLNEYVRYTRVIPGGVKIKHELCEHLCKLLADSRGRKLTNILLRKNTVNIGYYLVTDTGFLIFMPNPREKSPFDSCISMPGRPEISDRYREYVVEILGGTDVENVVSERRVRELCRVCSKRGKLNSYVSQTV